MSNKPSSLRPFAITMPVTSPSMFIPPDAIGQVSSIARDTISLLAFVIRDTISASSFVCCSDISCRLSSPQRYSAVLISVFWSPPFASNLSSPRHYNAYRLYYIFFVKNKYPNCFASSYSICKSYFDTSQKYL